LAITDQNRGFDSGFTGRFDKWQTTLNILSDGTWLFGKGIRSSDSMSDNLIDNSYLVILYELGIIPLLLITLRFCSAGKRSIGAFWHARNDSGKWFYLYCVMFLAVFLANNFVARFLFSIGNPYSFVALLLFLTPADRLSAETEPVAKRQMIRGWRPYLQPHV
jgi:O-antigen ligase